MITLNSSGTHYHVKVEEDDTKQLRRILIDYLPLVIESFAAKHRQYGENDFPLGVAGQFPEIWRKVKLLKSQIWDKRESAYGIDGTQEVVDDLIGHLLMLKDALVQEGRRQTSQEGRNQASLFDEAAISAAAAHAIRESKRGDETWIEGDSVVRPPDTFKGSHSYLVGTPCDGHLMVAVKGHSLRVAPNDGVRCPWAYGEGTRDDAARCLGWEGHENHQVFDTKEYDEKWHINRSDVAWEA